VCVCVCVCGVCGVWYVCVCVSEDQVAHMYKTENSNKNVRNFHGTIWV